MKTKDEIKERIKHLNSEWFEADELLNYERCEEIERAVNILKWVVGDE